MRHLAVCDLTFFDGRAAHNVRGARWLPQVCINRDGGGHGGVHERDVPRENPGASARCKARRQQAVVNFTCDKEAIERGGGQEKPLVGLAAVQSLNS